MIFIAAAGPLSNLLLAALAAFCFRTVPWGELLTEQTAWLIVPIASVVKTSVSVNVILAIFNLLPVPPLDGSRVLSGMLPLRQALMFSRLEPYGFMIIFLLIMSGVGNYILWPPVRSVTLALLRMWS